MFTVIPTDMAEWILTHNLQDWKRAIIDLPEVLEVNALLTENDIHTIISPEFYDAIHGNEPMHTILEEKYMDHLHGCRNTFITLHNLYNN